MVRCKSTALNRVTVAITSPAGSCADIACELYVGDGVADDDRVRGRNEAERGLNDLGETRRVWLHFSARAVADQQRDERGDPELLERNLYGLLTLVADDDDADPGCRNRFQRCVCVRKQLGA